MMSYSRLIRFNLCVSVLSYCLTNSAVATSSDICSKLSNHEGIYLVYPNGKPSEITKTTQHAKYDRGVAIYFVIDAVADQSELVDHYRILSTSQEKVDELKQVELSRSRVQSRCSNGFFGTFLKRNFEYLGTESITHYDGFRKKRNRGGSVNLAEWHFKWDNGAVGGESCPSTADHVPAILDDNPPDQVSENVSQLPGVSTANAEPSSIKLSLPKNTSGLTMVLVHRNADGSACHGVNLNFSNQTTTVSTVVDTMILGKHGTFKDVDQLKIIWDRTQ